jgi:hypothetical protein
MGVTLINMVPMKPISAAPPLLVVKLYGLNVRVSSLQG